MKLEELGHHLHLANPLPLPSLVAENTLDILRHMEEVDELRYTRIQYTRYQSHGLHTPVCGAVTRHLSTITTTTNTKVVEKTICSQPRKPSRKNAPNACSRHEFLRIKIIASIQIPWALDHFPPVLGYRTQGIFLLVRKCHRIWETFQGVRYVAFSMHALRYVGPPSPNKKTPARHYVLKCIFVTTDMGLTPVSLNSSRYEIPRKLKIP